ncbi:hypothetical protein Y032_0041g400 [Ancylostoma ceylanicum]|uniref:VWFA domain-containing protein n=1 Tax=Ancylostoma ceylanicum TaxID=53326 RepID=A0A016UHW7_9BILA|nr:hypothetical protein Y032_0041g400 [Ancylostoma ceylanicum]
MDCKATVEMKTIVFMLDGSGSVGTKGWLQQMDFMKSIASSIKPVLAGAVVMRKVPFVGLELDHHNASAIEETSRCVGQSHRDNCPQHPPRLRQLYDRDYSPSAPSGNDLFIQKGKKKVIYDFYSNPFDSHVHFPSCHLREYGYVILSVLISRSRHVIKSVNNCTTPGSDRIRPEHLKNLLPVLVNTMASLLTRYLSKCRYQVKIGTRKTSAIIALSAYCP